MQENSNSNLANFSGVVNVHIPLQTPYWHAKTWLLVDFSSGDTKSGHFEEL
jgi:hypothetical protein